METPKLIVRSCWCRNHKNVWKKRFLSAFEREKSCDQIKSVASNFSGSFQPFSLAVCKKRVQIEERPPWLEMSVCPHPNLGAWFGNQIWNPPFLLKRDVKRCSKNTDFFWLYRGFPSLIFFENIPFETGFQTRHTKNAQNVQKWAHKQPLAVLEWMKRNRRGHKSSHVEDEMGFLFSPFWQIINLDEGWCDSRNRQIRGKNNFKHWLFQGFLESIFGA